MAAERNMSMRCYRSRRFRAIATTLACTWLFWVGVLLPLSVNFGFIGEARRSPVEDSPIVLFKEGSVSAAVSLLQKKQDVGQTLDDQENWTFSIGQGLLQLKNGWFIPPRHPRAVSFKQRKLVYCLSMSMPFSTSGYSTRSHGVIKGLQQAGWHVLAVVRSGFPADQSMGELEGTRREIQIDGVTYIVSSGWWRDSTPLPSYMAAVSDYFMREADVFGAEIVVAASNHVVALPALAAARRLGLPFVYEVRGLWEVTRASLQPLWADSENFKISRGLEAQAAREADLVSTITIELMEELEQRGVDRQRIILVPNAAEPSDFRPFQSADAKLCKELGLPDGVAVIGFAGSLTAYEGLALLVEALAILGARGIDFVFLIVGDGEALGRIEASVKDHGIESQCRFVRRVPFSKISDFIALMDIMPIPRLSLPVTEMVSALKPLEAMAMGKALILSDVSRTF